MFFTNCMHVFFVFCACFIRAGAGGGFVSDNSHSLGYVCTHAREDYGKGYILHRRVDVHGSVIWLVHTKTDVVIA